MSKALTMGRVSAKGGFNLFWGLAISTVISAVGVIIVARLLSPSDYGIVTVALTAPSLVQILRDWGMECNDTVHSALQFGRQASQRKRHLDGWTSL